MFRREDGSMMLPFLHPMVLALGSALMFSGLTWKTFLVVQLTSSYQADNTTIGEILEYIKGIWSQMEKKTSRN